jgi:hypothetical protein
MLSNSIQTVLRFPSSMWFTLSYRIFHNRSSTHQHLFSIEIKFTTILFLCELASSQPERKLGQLAIAENLWTWKASDDYATP